MDNTIIKITTVQIKIATIMQIDHLPIMLQLVVILSMIV